MGNSNRCMMNDTTRDDDTIRPRNGNTDSVNGEDEVENESSKEDGKRERIENQCLERELKSRLKAMGKLKNA